MESQSGIEGALQCRDLFFWVVKMRVRGNAGKQGGRRDDECRLYDLCSKRLMEASERGEALCLVEGGSGLAVNGHGIGAMHNCCIHGHFEILKAMLEKGFDPLFPSGKNVTPLGFAARNGRVDCARLLMERGGLDLESRCSDGTNPLTGECERMIRCDADDLAKADIIGMLLPWFDPFEVYSVHRYTCVHGVCQGGGAKSLAMLMRFGMGDVRDAWGYTGFMRSAKFGHADQVAMWLEELDFETLTARQVNGMTALDFAEDRGDDDIVRMIEDGLAAAQYRQIGSASANVPLPKGFSKGL